MTFRNVPVDAYMTRLVRSLEPRAPLADAYAFLVQHGVSSAPVLDEGGRLLGVLSLTDLVRLGKPAPAGLRRAPVLALPQGTVGDVLEHRAVTVRPDASVASAATAMLEGKVHRVFVTEPERGRVAGVFSTRDVMRAVWAARLVTPLRDIMSTPVRTIGMRAPLSTAIAALAEARVRGLVVLDGGMPIGAFTQVEALAARDLPADTPVEDVMAYQTVFLDLETPLYRVAGYGVSMGARRMLALDGRTLVGIATGMDIARVAARP